MRPEHWLYALPLRLRSLLHRQAADQELDEELSYHLEQKTQHYIAQGRAPQAAHRAALLEMGGLEKRKEECRDARQINWLQDLLQDIHYGLRILRKSPGFTIVAVLTLALGIGASTVGFSVFYNLLFNAFAAKDAGRLVVPSYDSAETTERSGVSILPLESSLSTYDAIRAQNHVFEELAAYGRGIALLSSGHETRQVFEAAVTSNAFDFYGVPPLMGRGILPQDGRPGAPPVFVISYQLWKSEFNSDPKILGKTFLVDDQSRTLVGIMPPRFQAYGALVQIWMPYRSPADAARAGLDQHGTILARLRPGVTIEEASADLNFILQRLAMFHPDEFPRHFTARVQSATDFLMGPWGIGGAGGSEYGVKAMLYSLLAAVAILLLIACSNVTNLLLARATVRGREIAVRSALGATRGRLIRQLLVESSLLAVAACLVGTLFAHFGVKGAAAVIPHKGISIGGEVVIGLDRAVLFFTFGVTAMTTLICGLAPALHIVRGDSQSSLGNSGRPVSGSFRLGNVRNALVVAEVALSIVLLTGSGLLIHSFFLLTHVDLGFNPQNVLLLALGPRHPQTTEQSEITFRKVAQQLETLPGVAAVAVNNSLPGYNPGAKLETAVPGTTRTEMAGIDGCSESLYRTLGLHLVRGRWLSRSDVDSARHVTVLNQTLARDFFAGSDPIGQQIEVKSFPEKSQTPREVIFQIVGVIGDMKNFGPEQPAWPQAFIPNTITGGGVLLVKTKVDASSLMPAVQNLVWDVDRDQIAWQFEPLSATFNRLTYSPPQFGVTAVAPLAAIALLLVLTGVFSVMAYSVSLRTHEIGIRMALGAQPNHISRTVLRMGSRLIAAGSLIGLSASFALARLLVSQIWGVSPADPWTFGVVIAIIAMVGVAACYIAARRAMCVDPMVALRHE
jgi:predicted permease